MGFCFLSTLLEWYRIARGGSIASRHDSGFVQDCYRYRSIHFSDESVGLIRGSRGFHHLFRTSIQTIAAMCHQDQWRNMCDCQYNYCRDHRGREPCPNEVVNANDPLRPVYEPKGGVVRCAHPDDPSFCSFAERGLINRGLIDARADPHGRDCTRCMLTKAGVASGRDGRKVKRP